MFSVAELPPGDAGAVAASSTLPGLRPPAAAPLPVHARRDPGATAARQLALATARSAPAARHWSCRSGRHDPR